MGQTTTDASFVGSLPAIYQQYLVPLIFEPYAADLATRLSERPLRRVLEIAAGTGAVTRRLAAALPESVAIVATDLNQGMLDQAVAAGTPRPVEWRQADAMQLPFPDEAFDAVVCQFGAMFFPNRARGFAEARRVLRPGGVFLGMLYARHSLVAYRKWFGNALKAGQPWRSLSSVIWDHMESVGTKAYTEREVRQLFTGFSACRTTKLLTPYDTEELPAWANHVLPPALGWNIAIEATR